MIKVIYIEFDDLPRSTGEVAMMVVAISTLMVVVGWGGEGDGIDVGGKEGRSSRARWRGRSI